MAKVFYDMNCGFCSSIISWIEHKNNNGNLDFYDLSETKMLKLNTEDSKRLSVIDSVILVENSKVLFYSDAVIRLLILSGGFYKIIGFIIWTIPSFIRNPLYRTIAKNRFCLSDISKRRKNYY